MFRQVYCDFYSIAPNGTGRQDYDALFGRFLAALRSELLLRGQDPTFNASYETVFFGGGTPSLLSASAISELLNLMRDQFRFAQEAEITLETNPGTVDFDKLKQFRSAGVNRLSIGIQSFHRDDLEFLTRIHSADQAKECVRNAFKAGFDNVSLDLIFSLPNQTPERWRSNLEQAMELNPTHISCYSLIVEPNTPLYRMVQNGQVTTLSPDVDAELYEMTISFLADHGYDQYEVSNFARSGYRSRHNGNYWNHTNYLGFGPSAHSFWNGKRWWNLANTGGYAEKLEANTFPVAGEEMLSESQMWEERIFLGLRSDGVDTVEVRNRFQKDLLKDHSLVLEELFSRRLATFDGRRLRLTSKGYAVCDEICQNFFE